MTLMYWREHRTEFQIGLAYGVSEGTMCRTIKKVEDVLLLSKQLHLPVQPYRDRNRLAGCDVVISHDRWFLDRICTHILAFEGDSQARLFLGN